MYMCIIFFVNRGRIYLTTKQNNSTNGKAKSFCKSTNQRKLTNARGKYSVVSLFSCFKSVPRRILLLDNLYASPRTLA